jgi:ankyrin repeat protein
MLHTVASGAGQVEIVRLLISVGASVNCTNSYGWTPLHSEYYYYALTLSLV